MGIQVKPNENYSCCKENTDFQLFFPKIFSDVCLWIIKILTTMGVLGHHTYPKVKSNVRKQKHNLIQKF
jgi:hypothetical protein